MPLVNFRPMCCLTYTGFKTNTALPTHLQKLKLKNLPKPFRFDNMHYSFQMFLNYKSLVLKRNKYLFTYLLTYYY